MSEFRYERVSSEGFVEGVEEDLITNVNRGHARKVERFLRVGGPVLRTYARAQNGRTS